MAQVALASGFGSVRRFNETFHSLFHRPPNTLRRKSAPITSAESEAVTLRLQYRPPYDWDSILQFLEARAIPEVELVEAGRYLRTVEVDGAAGVIEVSHEPRRQSLSVKIHFPNVKALPGIVARVRRQFDLGADIETIGAHLSRDPQLAPLVAQRPGLRAPGGWDAFEIAVRAILGQQISVAAARRLAGQLVALHGKPLPKSQAARPVLSRLFPATERLAKLPTQTLGMPAPRLAALKALAQAAVADPHLFRRGNSVEETVRRLRTIRGIGEWTAQYIALRAIRETDAFPATDVGLLRGAAALNTTTPAALLERAEAWRPWRAYAAQHLWAADQPFLNKGQTP
jgi:AraC family transcriptional regulator of adaptative response / DNA-3-methyladenine glycosylase II